MTYMMAHAAELGKESGMLLCRMTLLFLTICLNATLLVAEEGLLTGVGPFAVYVEFEGPDPEVQQETCQAVYAVLRKWRIPTVEAKGMEAEDAPFLHLQLSARRIADPNGFLFTARTSVKVPTTNPFNGLPMHGLLTSGFAVEFKEDSNEIELSLNAYLKKTIGHFVSSWRKQNPLPDDSSLPNPETNEEGE